MSTINQTPLWLNLRTDYIDDNLEKLQSYLKNYSSPHQRDAFYETTINLLHERITMLLDELTSRPIYDEDSKDQAIFEAQLLATYILTDPNAPTALPAYLALIRILHSLHPNYQTQLLRIAIQRLRHSMVTSLGWNWNDLATIGSDLFAHKASTLARFSLPLGDPLVYTRHGSAYVTKDGLFLTHEDDIQQLIKYGASSIDTGLGVTLRTFSQNKIKQSHESDLLKIEDFTKDFIYQQYKFKGTSKSLKNYHIDSDVVVKVVRSTEAGIYVTTIDPDYNQIVGKITFKKENLLYHYTNQFYQYFREGDYLDATITDIDNPTFNIERQLVTHFVESVRQEDDGEYPFLCKLIDNKAPTHFGWLSNFGVAFNTPRQEGYTYGDFALLETTRYLDGQQYGRIDARIVDPSADVFDEKEVREECIREFAESTYVPDYAVAKEIDPTSLRIVYRMLFNHQALSKTIDRLKVLANANVLAEIVGDDISASYIQFARTYLLTLVQFVKNEDIRNIELHPEEEYKNAKSTLIRLSVIDLLREYGKKEDSPKLADTIASFSESIPMLARLARLIQTANSMQDILSDPALNVIRREIIKTLSIETEHEADLEGDDRIYLGVESGTQEFKTSMVYPPNNGMQPNETTQSLNVLKGVCAFLNSAAGGTLYLGVNDQGYVTGLSDDMSYLHMQSIDTYQRYIQDKAKNHFGIDTLPYLRIEPLYDNEVVAIHITPHPYKIVELNGTAYIRLNSESRAMHDDMRQQILARKIFKDKDKTSNISDLQNAIDQKKVVILHNYSSSHSGDIEDRRVEAYDIRPDDGVIIAFDIDKQKPLVFSIGRIGYVEITDKSWSYTAQHRQIQLDVFRMSGSKKIAVSLELDLLAKNLLVEEYPAAKNFIKPHKGDNDVWYFDTEVQSIEGVGRFFIGLANHIRIVNSPELRQYVANFTKRHLTEV